MPRAGAPSGRQVELRSGGVTATTVEVGAGLRELVVDGRAVLDGYRADEACPSARGAELLPWPNRISQGLYVWDGEQHRAPVNEWSLGNAIHGLTRWHNWQLAEAEGASATWSLRLHPSPGYPFLLDLTVAYALRSDGVTVTATAANAGATAAPFAYGAHPYLMAVPTGPCAPEAPDRTVDGDRLTVRAGTVLRVDATLVPVAREKVAPGTADSYDGDPIGKRQPNTTFTDLERGADGLTRAVLAAADGSRTVEVWQDEALPYLLVYTGDDLGSRARHSVALEPMSAPPNAFSSGESVVRLEPGETWTARWGITVR